MKLEIALHVDCLRVRAFRWSVYQKTDVRLLSGSRAPIPVPSAEWLLTAPVYNMRVVTGSPTWRDQHQHQQWKRERDVSDEGQ